MTSLFEQELLDMEREVRDMKTVHQRGLGTVRFYRASYTKQNASAGYNQFKVTLYPDELTPAVFTAHINTPIPARSAYVAINEQSYGATATVYTYTAGAVTIDVISSAQIQGIEEL